MAKVNISFRIHPYHYRALKEEIAKGKTLTGFFEQMLNERFPISSRGAR